MNYESIISQSRLEEIRNLINESKDIIDPSNFSISELKLIIDETPLSAEDREIAQLKYITGLKNIEIFFKMKWNSRVTVETHIKRIGKAMLDTCHKIFK